MPLQKYDGVEEPNIIRDEYNTKQFSESRLGTLNLTFIQAYEVSGSIHRLNEREIIFSNHIL